MKKYLLLLPAAIFISILLCSCRLQEKSSTVNSSELNDNSNLYSVTYIIEGNLYQVADAFYGNKLNPPQVDERKGYIFKGWYLSPDYQIKWNFEQDIIVDHICLYGFWVDESEDFYHVIFMNNDIPVRSVDVTKGNLISSYELTDNDGYQFIGWSLNGIMYDFNTPVSEDIVLSAIWKKIEYEITFVADGKIVQSETFDIDNMEISCPEVPHKEYYTGSWETFELKLCNITVAAIYTPVIYTATFVADDEPIKIVNYTVEDIIPIPDVPPKTGYIGEWIELPAPGSDVTVTAKYTPIIYTVTFIADSDIVATYEYTVEKRDYIPPCVPQKLGYVGNWADSNFETGDVSVYAEYTLINYRIDFMIDHQIYETVYYNLEDMLVTEPPLPLKPGYIGKWAEYSLNFDNITTVNASYIPITYEAIFIADNIVIERIPYTVETQEITEPALPLKDGYVGSWSRYNLSVGGITVYAIYEPIISSNPAPTVPTTEDFQFRLSDDGSYTIIGYSGNDTTDLIIPSEFDGVPIRSIGNSAFANNASIESVTISDGIQYIEDHAFSSCKNLVNLILSDSVTIVSDLAFSECSSLKYLTLGKQLTVIGKQAFYNCSSLSEIILPQSLYEIGADAFYGCPLSSVTFEKTIGWFIPLDESLLNRYDIYPYDILIPSDAAFKLRSYSSYCWRNEDLK